MDFLETFLPESLFSTTFILGLAIFLIACLYISSDNSTCYGNENPNSSYSYEEFNGPQTWGRKFPEAAGSNQSPINLQDRCSLVVPSDSQPFLKFSEEFHIPPSEMKVHNNGYCIAIYASWEKEKRPILFGGPLNEDYKFLHMRLRWGLNDVEGSEHMINSVQYAMELQAAFVSEKCKTEDIQRAAKDGGLLMLSYLFMITTKDNPYLEPIITSLKYVKCPMTCICIEPMILCLLMPDFSREYYTYLGSLTFPPCSEGVRWIVKPEPLMISSRQVRKFRKLCGFYGRIETNARPVQKLSGREVFYYD